MSSTSSTMFSGNDPRAQTAATTLRTRVENEFQQYMTQSKMASGTPCATGCCAKWGDHPDDQAMAAALFGSGNGSIATTDSENMGEMGAIYYLQKQLDTMGVTYNDDNLKVFAGANCFNLVYFHPDPVNPTHAIVLEAKGGNSGLGDRDDGTGTGARVVQGTPNYATTIANVMSDSKATDRNETGDALLQLMGQQDPKVAYIGVRTAYDKATQKVHNPVPIFFKML